MCQIFERLQKATGVRTAAVVGCDVCEWVPLSDLSALSSFLKTN